MKKTNVLIIGCIVLGLAFAWFFRNNFFSLSVFPDQSVNPTQGVLYDLIRLEQPKANQVVRSPLMVVGEARGTWFFEASFPVKIYDANGLELASVPAQAQSKTPGGEVNWMTQEFVPFKAVLEFKKPTTATGTLVLRKDNPSGLPEKDAELRIPIRFDLNK